MKKVFFGVFTILSAVFVVGVPILIDHLPAAQQHSYTASLPQTYGTTTSPEMDYGNGSAAVLSPAVSLVKTIKFHIGPDALYPDYHLTPGHADTLSLSDLTRAWSDSCPSGKSSCTYSQDHRNVPAKLHGQVYDEYQVPASERNIKNGEVDHFYPLCAGGGNEIGNLWYQPAVNIWQGQDYGYHAKDKLETYVCAHIKTGDLDPRVAFDRVTTDWVAYYQELKLGNTAAVNSTE